MHPGSRLIASWRSSLVPSAALLAAVLLVYLPTLRASFQFDDFRVVVADARVHSLEAWWQSMPAIRPLLRLSYAVGHELGGTPAAFRALNIGVHCINALLVLVLLRDMGTRCALPARAAGHAAMLAAALFALHPITTEAVTYISGRSSSLAALFALLALVCWVRARASAAPHPLQAIAIALGMAAVAVKESVAVLPLAMLLCSWIATPSELARRRQELRMLVPCTLALVVPVAAFAWHTEYPAMLDAALSRRALVPNLLTQAQGVAALLGHALLPWTVTTELDLAPVRTITPAACIPFAMLALIALAALAQLRRHPAIGFGVLWTALWLLPTHSLFAREDIANDRQFYLPLVGMAWLLACLMANLPAKLPAALRAREAVAAHEGGLGWKTCMLACVLLTCLAMATLVQNLTYRTEVTFWEAAVAAAPRNARAANNLGYAYALACRDADALRAFAVAQRLDPNNLQARTNHALLRKGALFLPGQRRCGDR